MWLVVGLGNPGPEYAANRHNLGFMVVDEVARRARLEQGWRAKFGGQLLSGEVAGRPTVLCKPQKYMNLSGEVVQPVAAFFKIDLARLLVVHDELDLDFGRMQVKAGGGTAGHNGLRSIAQRLGTPDFLRIRIGIGRPAGKDGADYVLADFQKAEKKELPLVIGEAADAVETVVGDGVVAAMNRFNRRKEKDES